MIEIAEDEQRGLAEDVRLALSNDDMWDDLHASMVDMIRTSSLPASELGTHTEMLNEVDYLFGRLQNNMSGTDEGDWDQLDDELKELNDALRNLFGPRCFIPQI